MTAQRLISKSPPAYRSDNRGPRTFPNNTAPKDDEPPGLALEPVDKGFIWPRGWEPGWPMVPRLLVLGRTAADVSIERKERSFGRREEFSEADTAAAVVCGSDCGLLAVLNQPENIK